MKGRRTTVLIAFIVGLAITLATPALAGTARVTLVVDAEGKAGLPRNYRSTSVTSELDGISAAGLDKLRASGSGQFSGQAFAEVLKRADGAPLVDLDLREESHGFVGDTAVSWYGTRNWSNRDKTPEQIGTNESELLAGLMSETTITVQEVTKKNADGDIASSKRFELPAQPVESEEQLVRAQGAGYARMYVRDHVRFTDDQVDALVALWQSRSPGSWLHVHCRAGDGRTTQALVIFDMLENANTVSLKDIVKRQEALGETDVLSVRSKPAWRHDGDAGRAALVRRFYRYAQEHWHGEGETWSSWSARNP